MSRIYVGIQYIYKKILLILKKKKIKTFYHKKTRFSMKKINK